MKGRRNVSYITANNVVGDLLHYFINTAKYNTKIK